MKARRHRPEGVVPLELWDALVFDLPLYTLSTEETPRAVAHLVRELRAGNARRARARTPLPKLDVARVVLAGGGPLVEVAHALHAVGVEAEIAEDPQWIAEPGGRALLATFCDASRGAVLDVGQTALKYSDSTGRTKLARALDQVPLELHARDPAQQPEFRARTVEFLASALCEAVSGLVLALPCEIEDDLSVAGCSYPWRAGDRALVRDVLSAAALLDTPCLVLNDAELAAVSVDLSRARETATLVLTLGLGLGGAYLPAK